MNSADRAQADAIAAQLTAAGAPFELTEIERDGQRCRVFRRAPATLGDLYLAADRFAGQTFTVFNEQRLTYAEGLAQAGALAASLARLGIGQGSRVALVMHNRPEWMIAFIAVTALGASAVLVNSRGTAPELAAALTDTGCALAITDTSRARLIAERQPALPQIVVEDGELSAGWTAFEEAIAGWRSARLQPAAVAPDDEAVIMFTSGTTGGAKGVLLSHRGVLNGLMNIQYSMAVIGARLAARYGAEAMAAAAARQPSSLLVFPLFHSSGCYSVFLSNFMRGGKVVVLQKWNAEAALDLIEREQIGAFSGSPTMVWDMLRLDRSSRNLDALVSVGVGGQALSPQLMREITAAFPRAMLGAGYGMTETNGSVCMVAGDELLERPTTSGRVLPTAELKIVDAEGNELPTGEVGEIWMRGAMLMSGYCNHPEATAKALQGGWMHSGDMGRLDEDGFLHVVDRIKDIVIAGGENISCTEVENAAVEHPAVAEAAAFGLADERLGERLVLAVVPAAGATVDEEALKRHIGERLAIYKVPRQIVCCASLPRNAMTKVNRAELRRQLGFN